MQLVDPNNIPTGLDQLIYIFTYVYFYSFTYTFNVLILLKCLHKYIRLYTYIYIYKYFWESRLEGPRKNIFLAKQFQKF